LIDWLIDWLRWIDNVTADIKERGSCMQMAKELVHNREEWRSLTIQPRRRQPPGEWRTGEKKKKEEEERM